MDQHHFSEDQKQFQTLHERAVRASEDFRNSQAALIDVLQEIDAVEAFYPFGCSSLHEYAMVHLKLSEDVAYTLIRIARISEEVPEVKESVQSGEMTTSNARMIAPVIEKMMKDERVNQDPEAPTIESVIEDAKNLSKRELEKKIASQNPELAVPERVHYVAAERLKMTIGISEELLEKLRRVQDLESQRLARSVSLEEAIEVMTGEYLKRQDPVEKAKRAEVRGQKRETRQNGAVPVRDAEHAQLTGQKTHKKDQAPVPEREDSSAPGREYVPAALKHEVHLRDKNQCGHIDEGTGKRCSHRRWLDVHHIQPVSRGGRNTLENLVLLCRGHHRWVHR